MKISKTITTLAITSLLVAGFAGAQEQGGPGMPPPGQGQGRPGMMQDRKEFRQERREDWQEMRGEAIKAGEQFKDDMQARKNWMMGSSTSGTATPTPWKNLRENMKDIKQDYRQDREDARQDWRNDHSGMPPPMRPINATATAAIAAKLGITAESLQAQLASGTKLKEIIKDKISPEEMKNILPPRVATFTRAIEEKGFFNGLRSRLFGPRQEVMERRFDEFGEATTTVSSEQPPVPFWKRFFGF